MNRQIEFRGLRTDNGEWAYGAYAPGFGGSYAYIMPKCYFSTRDFGDEDENGNMVLSEQFALGGFVPVLPDSVGQFTGITDRNGVKVFEDDYIRIGEIPGLQKVLVSDIRELQDIEHERNRGIWFEVTGNIHQNK